MLVCLDLTLSLILEISLIHDDVEVFHGVLALQNLHTAAGCFVVDEIAFPASDWPAPPTYTISNIIPYTRYLVPRIHRGNLLSE